MLILALLLARSSLRLLRVHLVHIYLVLHIDRHNLLRVDVHVVLEYLRSLASLICVALVMNYLLLVLTLDGDVILVARSWLGTRHHHILAIPIIDDDTVVHLVLTHDGLGDASLLLTNISSI